MKAIWNGEVVAQSEDTIIVEGNHYFPPNSIRKEFFSGSKKVTHCPWKGYANYLDIKINGEINSDACWVYRNPTKEGARIKDFYAFWKGVEVVKENESEQFKKISDYLSKMLQSMDSDSLIHTLPEEFIHHLSFFNYENSITSCFFADHNFIIQKVNPTFEWTFQGLIEPKQKYLLDVLEQIGVCEEDIKKYKKQLEFQGWSIIQKMEVIRDDETRYFSLYSIRTNHSDVDSLLGYQGELIDVTHEVLLEKRQDQVAAQIRHDMKNRISANFMESDFLIHKLNELKKSDLSKVEEFFEELDDALGNIRNNAKFLSGLVVQMLDVDKLRHGMLKLKLEKVNLKSLLQEVQQALDSKQKQEGISVLLPDDELELEADYVQLSRIIENYHSNALKYASSKVVWKLEQEAEYVILTVQDDGDGIEEKNLQRIFDPFFQVEGNEKKDSTGLGLDSVKELVQLHQGQTWAESEGLGQGTSFKIKLPLTQDRAEKN